MMFACLCSQHLQHLNDASRMSTGTKRPKNEERNEEDSNDDNHAHPRRTFRRIADGLEVLRGLGQHHPAVGASIEMGHEAIAFVTGLTTFEKTRQLVNGQAIVGTRHRGDLQFLFLQ